MPDIKFIKPTIKFTKLHSDARLPVYSTVGAAGADLHAVFDDGATGVLLEPGDRCMISTGLGIEIPDGFEVQIRPRSGLAFKYGVTVINAPGTIDCDYRGEVGVVLINHGAENFVVKPGDRIAQMVVAAVEIATLVFVDKLSDTDRGAGGYGSTGVAA